MNDDVYTTLADGAGIKLPFALIPCKESSVILGSVIGVCLCVYERENTMYTKNKKIVRN